MIVAGFQMEIAWEDPAANFRGVAELTARTLRGPGTRPHLLVLPEMFATGFSMDAVKVAEFAQETRDFLSDLAQRHRLHVLGGYAEPSGPRPANACSLFDPAGSELLHYRKLHPFSLAREDEHYLPGDTLATAEVEGVRVTPLICYDLRFPEPFRAAAAGTDLFCVLANWPAKRRSAWSTLLKARAIENQAYVLGVNRVGEGGGEPHSGDSVLVDPLGAEIALARAERGEGSPAAEAGDSGREGVVTGEVDPADVARIRSRFSFLADRRPELYRKLERERSLSRS